MRRQEAHDRTQAEIRAGTRAQNPRAFDYTPRARRYANHKGGRKYGDSGEELPRDAEDEVKAESARIFFAAWKAAEAGPRYARRKKAWKEARG